MWDLYKLVNGKTPSREEITTLSEELNLKENQIYKWFWDTKKKVEEDTALARQMQEQEGSKRSSSKVIGVEGRDGLGERMTPQQIKTALKIH